MTTIDQVIAANEAFITAVQDHESIFPRKKHGGFSIALEEAQEDAAEGSKKTIIQRFVAFIKRIKDWFLGLFKKREQEGKDSPKIVEDISKKEMDNIREVHEQCAMAAKRAEDTAAKMGIDIINKVNSKSKDVQKQTQELLDELATKAAKVNAEKPVASEEPKTKANSEAPTRFETLSARMVALAMLKDIKPGIVKLLDNKAFEIYSRDKNKLNSLAWVREAVNYGEFRTQAKELSECIIKVSAIISSISTWRDADELNVKVPDFDFKFGSTEMTVESLKTLAEKHFEHSVQTWLGLTAGGVISALRNAEKTLDQRIASIDEKDISEKNPELIENLKALMSLINEVSAARIKFNKVVDYGASMAKYITDCDAAIISFAKNKESFKPLVNVDSIKARSKAVSADIVEEVLLGELRDHAIAILSDNLLGRKNGHYND